MGFSCSGFLNRLLRTVDFRSVISGRTLSHVASLIAYTFKQTDLTLSETLVDEASVKVAVPSTKLLSTQLPRTSRFASHECTSFPSTPAARFNMHKWISRR